MMTNNTTDLLLFQEKCNAINGLCNKLAKVRIKAKKTKENVQFWEALVTEIKTFIADKTLEHEMVRGSYILIVGLIFQLCQNKVLVTGDLYHSTGWGSIASFF